jgi:ATP-dependent HslUV protease ATP-binding subunit HslU
MSKVNSLTPREIVEELDKYVVGQKEAKRSVAVALRNRYRRSLLADEIKEEIVPKNILMIGPTGVGKTEIARRLAKFVGAPFVKVEATKFTEVGYVGRDVESMVRDLMEVSIRMVKTERTGAVEDRAEVLANERIIELLAPSPKAAKGMSNPLEMLFGKSEEPVAIETGDEELTQRRRSLKFQLLNGSLEDEMIEIEVEEQAALPDALAGMGMDQIGFNMQDLFAGIFPKKMKKRKTTIRDARQYLKQEEAHKLIDMDEIIQEAIERTEESGIIFIDEIDKIASKEHGPDVSREGVQRDILPIVEGSTVVTKYGPVKTDYILFIAAGAFHMSKPSDLVPELQGRFPIRVELSSLSTEDFVRILTEPKNSLIMQYRELLRTEGIEIEFTEETIQEIAKLAYEVNQEMENIGARRLSTLLEKLLEDLSFEAPEVTLKTITITPEYVEEKLATLVRNRDLSQYIL